MDWVRPGGLALKLFGYKKSGTHLARALLDKAGVPYTFHHALTPGGLHVARDARGVVCSAVCYYILKNKEHLGSQAYLAQPEDIRPHVFAMAERIRDGWDEYPGWNEYILQGREVAKATLLYRDLVYTPFAALERVLPLGFTHRAVTGLEREISTLSKREAWNKHKLRRGNPFGWQHELTDQQIGVLTDWFRPGLEALGLA